MYALVIHQGGAPEWSVQPWINFLQLKKRSGARAKELKAHPLPILDLMRHDLEQVAGKETSVDDAISELPGRSGSEGNSSTNRGR